MAPSRVKSLQIQKEKLLRKHKTRQVLGICGELAEHFSDAQNYEAALQEFHDRLELAEELGDRKEMALSFRCMAETCLPLRLYETGLKYAREYLDIMVGLGIHVEIQRALVTMGTMYYEFYEFSLANLGDWNETMAQCSEALDYFQRAQEAIDDISGDEVTEKEKSLMRCGCFFNRALCLKKIDKKNYDLFLDKTDKIALKEGLEEWRSTILFERASNCPSKDFATAKTIYEAILNLKKLKSDLQIRAMTELAQQALDCRSYKESLTWWKKAILAEREVHSSINLKGRTYAKNQHNGVKVLMKKVDQIVEMENNKAELYERVGDICSGLRAPNAARFYYKEAVNLLAETGHQQNSKLPDLYFSIGLCYFEAREYSGALKYFRLEQSLRGSTFTSLKIIKCLSTLGNLYAELEKEVLLVLGQGIDATTKLFVLKCFFIGQQKMGLTEEAETTRAEIKRLEDENELDKEVMEKLVKENVEEVDDFSTDSDDEMAKKEKPRRVSKPTSKMRVNAKGETDLHLLCQKDNQESKIKELIKTLKYVDIVDYSGFSPLHEACNYGFCSYVQLLHEAGADLNRTANHRITPLISAASNGHLLVTEYLLENKADVSLQDGDGWTAENHLKEYLKKHGQLLDFEEKEWINKLLRTMSNQISKLKESGHNVNVIKKQKQSSALICITDQEKAKETEDTSSLLPTQITNRSELSIVDSNVHKEVQKDVKDYVTSIDELKHKKLSSFSTTAAKRKEDTSVQKTMTNYEFNVYNDENEWIENDLGHLQQKKKRRKTNKIDTNSNINEGSLPPLVEEREIEENRNALPLSESSSTLDLPKVTVEVQERKFLVPITCALSDKVLILCDIVAQRYEKEEGSKPKLRLITKDGAELNEEDAICDVIDDREVYVAEVLGWDLKPLTKRYEELCKEMNLMELDDVKRALSDSEDTNSFSISLSLRRKLLEPIFKSLKNRNNLTELNLSQNKLGSDGLSLLIEVLKTLTNLKKLDLSCNALTFKDLNLLIPNDTNQYLNSLTDLNLSFNPLGDESREVILRLLKHFKGLKKLSLNCCSISKMFFTVMVKEWSDVMESPNMEIFDLKLNFKPCEIPTDMNNLAFLKSICNFT